AGGGGRAAVGRVEEDRLVVDANGLHHQKAHVTDDVVGQGLVGDVIPRDVEPERPPGQPTPVGELDLEIELDPSVGHRSPSRRRPSPAPARRVSYGTPCRPSTSSPCATSGRWCPPSARSFAGSTSR